MNKHPLFLFLRDGKKYCKIHLSEICYIEACKNYCRIVLEDRHYLILGTIKFLEGSLPESEFCRIHRAYIVRIGWLTAFDQRWVYGPGKVLPVGECYRKALPERVWVIQEEARSRPEAMVLGV